MSIKVKDFGPIDEADITLKPFTIIIGKNNIGKSYLTQLFQALHESFRYEYIRSGEVFLPIISQMRRSLRYIPFPEYSTGLSRGVPGYRLELDDEMITDIRSKLKNKNVNNRSILVSVLRIMNNNIPDSLVNRISISLSQAYGMEIKNLVRLNVNKSIIQFEYNEYNTLYIEISTRGRVKVQYKPNRGQISKLSKDASVIIKETRNLKRLTKKRVVKFCAEIIGMILSVPIRQSMYLPAGRAGLIEGYDTIVSMIIELASLAPMYGITMPPIQGLAAQFYNVLFSLHGRKGPYSGIAEDMLEILGGTLSISRPRGLPRGAGRIFYTFKHNEKSRSVPVIQAASMIQEISPLYLIIKEALYPGSRILIEEPESHMHPSAQCKLIEIFTKLSSEDVNVVITTHSDLMVRKLGNLISSFKYNNDSEDIKVNPEDVALYLMKEGNNGSVLSEIIIPDDGIFESIPEFDEIVNQLYEEQLKYQRLSQKV